MTDFTNLLTAGDTLDFDTCVPDYPASAGWTLKYRLSPRAGGSVINITATADGADYTVQVIASTTANWAAGYYTWSAYVELGAEVYTVGRGELEIRTGSATMATGHDGRSHARKMLDAIEAALESLNFSNKSYTIGTRSFTRRDIPELTNLRNQYRAEVHAETLRDNGGSNKLVVRF